MSKHVVALIVLILALALLLNARAADNGQSPASTPENEKPSLEVQKLKLEVQKIQTETRSINLQPLLQMGTLMAALVAATISFWSAWKTQRNQTATPLAQGDQKRQERISDLLKELGSEQLAVRIAAIQALSEYESSAPFLVNLLRIEDEPRVLAATLTALKRMPAVALPLLAALSRSLHEQHLQFANELTFLRMEKDEVVRVLGLDLAALNAVIHDSRYKRSNDSLNVKLIALKEMGTGTDDEIILTERQRVLKAFMSSHLAYGNVLDAVEAIAKYAIDTGPCDVSKAYLRLVNLEGADVSGWSFEGADLAGASFKGATCQATNFSGADLSGALFTGARMHDAIFTGTMLDKAVFRRAALRRANFVESSGKATEFQGAKLNNSDFERAKFVEGRFQGSFPEGANFTGAELFRSDFTAALCPFAKFTGANLSGSRLNDIKATRADFSNAILAGTNLTKARLVGANFNKATLKAIEQFNDAVLKDSTWEDASFGDQTESFHTYVQEQLQSANALAATNANQSS